MQDLTKQVRDPAAFVRLLSCVRGSNFSPCSTLFVVVVEADVIQTADLVLLTQAVLADFYNTQQCSDRHCSRFVSFRAVFLSCHGARSTSSAGTACWCHLRMQSFFRRRESQWSFWNVFWSLEFSQGNHSWHSLFLIQLQHQGQLRHGRSQNFLLWSTVPKTGTPSKIVQIMDRAAL